MLYGQFVYENNRPKHSTEELLRTNEERFSVHRDERRAPPSFGLEVFGTKSNDDDALNPSHSWKSSL